MTAPLLDISNVCLSLPEPDAHGNTDLYVEVETHDVDGVTIDGLWPGSARNTAGALAVRFLVDDQVNQVLVDEGVTSPRDTIAYAIDVLTTALAAFDSVPNLRPGQCMHLGDEGGRCRERSGHPTNPAAGTHGHTSPTWYDRAAMGGVR